MTEKELLKKLGIWPNLNGYQYLLKGFELIRENSDYLQCVTKRLYPDIGKVYKAKWPSVERAIRTCVISCWAVSYTHLHPSHVHRTFLL